MQEWGWKGVLIALSWLGAQSAFASFYDSRPMSLRGRSMGQAITALTSSTDSLHWNPSRLCKESGFNWKIFEMSLYGNTVEAVDQGLALTQVQGLSDYSELFGTKFNLGGFAQSAVQVPCLGAAYTYQLQFRTQFDSPIVPETSLFYALDQSVVVGYSQPLGSGLSAGVNLARVSRTGGGSTLGPGELIENDVAALTQSLQQTGQAYTMDLALGYETEMLPGVNFSAAWVERNVAVLGFTNGLGRLDSQQVLAVGADWDLELGRVSIGLEARDLPDRTEDIGRKFGFGGELSLLFADVWGGIHQGYTSLGAGFDFYIFRVEASTWGEERGVFSGQDQNRRYAFLLSTSYSFDTDFIFESTDKNSSGQKRSRPKQRR